MHLIPAQIAALRMQRQADLYEFDGGQSGLQELKGPKATEKHYLEKRREEKVS